MRRRFTGRDVRRSTAGFARLSMNAARSRRIAPMVWRGVRVLVPRRPDHHLDEDGAPISCLSPLDGRALASARVIATAWRRAERDRVRDELRPPERGGVPGSVPEPGFP